MADSVTLGSSGSDHKEFTIQSTEIPPPPPPPPPDFETLWPLLIHVVGSILVGTAAISASSA